MSAFVDCLLKFVVVLVFGFIGVSCMWCIGVDDVDVWACFYADDHVARAELFDVSDVSFENFCNNASYACLFDFERFAFVFSFAFPFTYADVFLGFGCKVGDKVFGAFDVLLLVFGFL